MPKAKNTRGGSKKGKLKPGKNRKGWGHRQTRLSVKKTVKQDAR